MWLGTRAGEARRFRFGTASLCAFLLVASRLATLSAQGTPAGSHIRNWATLAYTSSGFGYVVPSDTVDLVVAQVAGALLQPAQSAGGSPGASAVFAHTLTNLGNGADSCSGARGSGRRWPVALQRNCDGYDLLARAQRVLLQ